jgi:tight adherence protein B
MNQTTILIALVVVVVVVMLIAIVALRGKKADDMEDRLGQYTDISGLVKVSEETEREEMERRKRDNALAKSIDQTLEKRGIGGGLKVKLSRADLKLTVTEFLIAQAASLVIVGLLAFFVLWPGQFVVAIIAAVFGYFLPQIYLNMLMGKRLKEFERQLPDTIGLWVNGLRAGYSALQALEAIGREAPQPSSGEIRRVVQENQFGVQMEVAFDHLLTRMPSPDLDLIITAVNVQREVGGNLAEILEVIGHTIRERIRIKGEIQILTAQGRLTGWLIGGLPIFMGIVLSIINPGYMSNLIQNRGCGWPMMALALGMIGMGMAVIQRIVDIEI